MRITFQLEPDDIANFQIALDRSRRLAASADEVDVVDAARQALAAMELRKLPTYVRSRLRHVERMLAMLEDEAWALPDPERDEVLAALVYFSDPDDLIPDHLELIGLIDDAIMIEMLARRLHHTLRAHGDFCAYRDSLGPLPMEREARVQYAARLADSRASLHQRIRKRERVRARKPVDALLERNEK